MNNIYMYYIKYIYYIYYIDYIIYIIYILYSNSYIHGKYIPQFVDIL